MNADGTSIIGDGCNGDCLTTLLSAPTVGVASTVRNTPGRLDAGMAMYWLVSIIAVGMDVLTPTDDGNATVVGVVVEAVVVVVVECLGREGVDRGGLGSSVGFVGRRYASSRIHWLRNCSIENSYRPPPDEET